MNDRVKRTTAKALTAATALAVAGVVAGAGTLSAELVASPAVEPASYSVPHTTTFEPVGLASRSTFAERASRDAARQSAHLAKLRKAKKAAAHKKAVRAKRLAAKTAAAKRAHLSTRPVAAGSARAIGKKMAARHGWTGQQWAALDRLWQAESGWRVSAGNSSGAYGIPQALPGHKMARAGGDWRTSASTQIEWGLDYIAGRWGSPARAWNHFQAAHWY